MASVHDLTTNVRTLSDPDNLSPRPPASRRTIRPTLLLVSLLQRASRWGQFRTPESAALHPTSRNARPEQPAFTSPSNQPANRPTTIPPISLLQTSIQVGPNPAQPNRPPSNPANQPELLQPNNHPDVNSPTNRPGANLPPAAKPNQPVPTNCPGTSRWPTAPTKNRPNQPSNQSNAARPQTNRQAAPVTRSDRPSAAPRNKRLETDRPDPSQTEEPQSTRSAAANASADRASAAAHSSSCSDQAGGAASAAATESADACEAKAGRGTAEKEQQNPDSR